MNHKSLLSAFLKVILISGLVLVIRLGTVQASTGDSGIPKPSVPEFTVKFVNASYPVTTTNPYTGLSETSLVVRNSIQITFKNQVPSNSNNQICYNIRVKPHFTSNWTEIYPIENRTSSYNGDGTFSYAEYVNYNSPRQSASSYSLVTFPVVPTDLYQATGYDIKRYFSGDQYTEGTYVTFLYSIPDGAQIDFQAEALMGHSSQAWVIDHPLYPTIGGHFAPAVAYDSASDWSNTQTVTIGESQTPTTLPATTPTPTPAITPYQEPQQTDQLEIIIGVAIAAAVIGAGLGLLLYLIKRK